MRRGPRPQSAGELVHAGHPIVTTAERLTRRPRPERNADLPLLTERVDNPAEAPPVLVTHRRCLRRARGYRLSDDSVRVIDHEQRPARRAADRARAETLHLC